MKVSVVVATYRRDDCLERALSSLATQDYEDFEIVLVDDNGDAEWNRRVADIVAAFKKKNPDVAIKYIANSPNQGSAKTRNIGIAEAEGEYVTFLDDDDLYLPEKIKNQVKFMQMGGYDYSVTDLDLFNESDKLIDKRVRSYIKDTSPEALAKYHLMHHITGTDTMMFKKEYLDRIGGFAPIDVGDEYYLIQRAIDGGGSFGYLPVCDIKAYVHTGENTGISSGEGKIKGENTLYEYKRKYFDRLDRKSRRYIKMRHYAVLAFAYLRMKKFIPFFKNGFISFFTAPLACVRLVMVER